jgi:hypothetical protein
MLVITTDFARIAGYSRIVLDSSKNLDAARVLQLNESFVDIPRYCDNYRADVFMERRLIEIKLNAISMKQ